MQETTKFVEWTSLRKAEGAVPELASDKNAERHTLKMLESAFLTLAQQLGLNRDKPPTNHRTNQKLSDVRSSRAPYILHPRDQNRPVYHVRAIKRFRNST